MGKTRQGQEQQQSANTERLSGRIWVKHGKKGDSEIPNYIVVKLWKEMKKFHKINIKKVISQGMRRGGGKKGVNELLLHCYSYLNGLYFL